MTYQIKLRRDEAANWTSTNPILAAGEPGYETDTTRLKVGNGVDAWNDLPYQAPANVNAGYGIVVANSVISVNNTQIQAQANIAVDNKVTKTFIDGLAVNYNSLSNTPTNVSVFNNDAGYLVSANLTSLTANVNSVNSLTGNVVLTTDNIAQGNTNLYYSNAQVNAFIQNSITTTDIDEGANLYYSNARVNAFIQNSITTTDIDEGANLYYTNARVIAHIATVPLSVGGNLTVNGNLEVQGNIDYVNVQDLQVVDNEIILNYGNATAREAFIIVDRSGSALNNAHVKWNEIDDRWEIYDGSNTYIVPRSTTDLTEGANLYYSNARVNAFIQSDITTTDIDEGANLYYSNARVNAFIQSDITTTDIDEGANLYYSNARVNAFIQDSITTTDIDEGTNLYYTDARANTAIGAYQGDISTAGNITAAKFTGNAVELFGMVAGNVVFDPNNLFANTIVNVQAALDNLQINKLDVNSLTSSVTFFSTTANSNIAGYTKLVTTTSDPNYDDVAVNVPTGTITTSNQLLANLVSAQNVLTGNTTPINITTIGNIRKTAGGSGQNARFYFEVYKRTDANVETLIGTSDLTPEITSAAYEEFSDIALITDTNFTANDSVVLKFYGTNVGGGSPTYDFQFGGTNPIRTLFPVPVSVIPVDNTADSIETDTSNFNGVLSGADDTAQKAFNTIDNLTTTSVPEGTNLYFSNARVNAFIQGNITTTDIDEGANLYYSNARVNAFIQSSITTTDIDEGANLYYTTARANTAIGAYQGNINTAGDITANEIFADFIGPNSGALNIGAGPSTVGFGGDVVDIASNTFTINSGLTTFTNDVRFDAIANISIVETDTILTPDGNSYIYLPGTNSPSDIVILNGDGGAIKLSNVDDVGVTIHSNAAVDSAGNITAPYFIGNGSLLTGITAGTNYTDANVITLLGSLGNVINSNANITTNANVITNSIRAENGNAILQHNTATNITRLTTASNDPISAQIMGTSSITAGAGAASASTTNISPGGTETVTLTAGSISQGYSVRVDIGGVGNRVEYVTAAGETLNDVIQKLKIAVDAKNIAGITTTATIVGDPTVTNSVLSITNSSGSSVSLSASSFTGGTAEVGSPKLLLGNFNGVGLTVNKDGAISGNTSFTTTGDIITSSILAQSGNVAVLYGNPMLQHNDATKTTRLTTATNDPVTAQIMGTSQITSGPGVCSFSTSSIGASGTGTVQLSAATISAGYSVRVDVGGVGNRAEYVAAAGETLNDVMRKLKIAIDAKNITNILISVTNVADPTVTNSVMTITNSGGSSVSLSAAAFTGGTPEVGPKLLLGNFNGVGLNVNKDGTISGNTNFTTTGDIQGNFIRGNGSALTNLNTNFAGSNVKLQQFAETVVALGNVSGDISSNIDLDLGTIFTMTATGNITINSMANASPGVSATLIITQDGTGNRLLTSNWKFADAANVLSNAASTTDIVTALFAGNVYYATLSKGYA